MSHYYSRSHLATRGTSPTYLRQERRTLPKSTSVAFCGMECLALPMLMAKSSAKGTQSKSGGSVASGSSSSNVLIAQTPVLPFASEAYPPATPSAAFSDAGHRTCPCVNATTLISRAAPWLLTAPPLVEDGCTSWMDPFGTCLGTNYGSGSCQAWDHPNATVNDKVQRACHDRASSPPPLWCFTGWCYVDADKELWKPTHAHHT